MARLDCRRQERAEEAALARSFLLAGEAGGLVGLDEVIRKKSRAVSTGKVLCGLMAAPSGSIGRELRDVWLAERTCFPSRSSATSWRAASGGRSATGGSCVRKGPQFGRGC